jgi:hypothetical protein
VSHKLWLECLPVNLYGGKGMADEIVVTTAGK